LPSYSNRLDRFISKAIGVKRSEVRALLASGRVQVDGLVAKDIAQLVGQFSHITVDQKTLQAVKPVYVMMHKPAGVVSATKDDKHQTVVDLLERDDREQLHIAGRLDFNSTGLLLLSNDGDWSKQLSLPERNIQKVYTVTLAKPVTADYVDAFAAGIFFEHEGITTRPAQIKILSGATVDNSPVYRAEVWLCEGRYHQIKRMFGRFQNEVLALHRHQIGNLILDKNLLPGQSRDLSEAELSAISGY
jgi:16S rRNA pseudouridine516 synthase